MFKFLRNKVVKNVRKAKADFFLGVIKDAKGNGIMIWENTNKLLGREAHKPNNIELNGILIKDCQL